MLVKLKFIDFVGLFACTISPAIFFATEGEMVFLVIALLFGHLWAKTCGSELIEECIGSLGRL